MDNKALEIIVSANLKNFEEAMRKIEKQTENLSDNLANVAAVSTAAFVAIAAGVGISVKAYGAQEKATKELSQALQQQGIYSDDLLKKYDSLAEAIEAKTGQDAQQTKSGIALAQGYLGEIEITEDLMKAVSDLSERKGIDLKSAYEKVAKTIGTNTNALAREGIEIDMNTSKSQRLAQVVEQLNGKFGGSAEAAAKGQGVLKLLEAQFDNMLQGIGKRFAPMIEAAGKALANLFTTINQNEALLDFIVSVAAAGAVVTGVVAVVSLGGLAFLKLKAALEAARIATSAMTIATRGLVAATGLGLLVILATEIYLNWNSIWPRMQAVFQAFVNNITNVGLGLKDFLMGVMTLDTDLIKAGIDKAKNAIVQGFNDATKDIKPIEAPIAVQDEKLKKAAEARHAIENEYAQRALDRANAENELRILKANEGSQQLLQLKNDEIEILKALEDKKNADISAQLENQLARNQQRQAEQIALEKEQRAIINQELLVENEEFFNLSQEQKDLFYEQVVQKEQARVLTENTARMQLAADRLKNQVDTNNKFLLEQEKFGKSYAIISKIINSQQVQEFTQASNYMIEMQGSSNATLKGIGKAFAISDIGIKTAQAAMNVYAGFATIPIVGPALGLAAAAAAVAFGAEKIGRVTAANRGGVIPGTGPNRDSVFSFLTPGELVSPQESFDEVVEGTARQRGFVRADEEVSSGGLVGILQEISTKLDNLGQSFSVHVGGLMVDNNSINELAEHLRDAVQYRGARVS